MVDNEANLNALKLQYWLAPKSTTTTTPANNTAAATAYWNSLPQTEKNKYITDKNTALSDITWYASIVPK